MTLEIYRAEIMLNVHHIHVAQIANAFKCTVNDLICDAYAGEIDDINSHDPYEFVRWIDSISAHH